MNFLEYLTAKLNSEIKSPQAKQKLQQLTKTNNVKLFSIKSDEIENLNIEKMLSDKLDENKLIDNNTSFAEWLKEIVKAIFNINEIKQMADTNSDGKISNTEGQQFLKNIADVDGDASSLSINDIDITLKNIGANLEDDIDTPSDGGGGGDDKKTPSKPFSDMTESELKTKKSELETELTKIDNDLKALRSADGTGSINTAIKAITDYKNTHDFGDVIGDVGGEDITTAKNKLDALVSERLTLQESAGEKKEELVKQGSKLLELNDKIEENRNALDANYEESVTAQNAIAEQQKIFDEQQSIVDGCNLKISGYESQISILNSQIQLITDSTAEEQKNSINAKNSSIREQIATLQKNIEDEQKKIKEATEKQTTAKTEIDKQTGIITGLEEKRVDLEETQKNIQAQLFDDYGEQSKEEKEYLDALKEIAKVDTAIREQQEYIIHLENLEQKAKNLENQEKVLTNEKARNISETKSVDYYLLGKESKAEDVAKIYPPKTKEEIASNLDNLSEEEPTFTAVAEQLKGFGITNEDGTFTIIYTDGDVKQSITFNPSETDSKNQLFKIGDESCSTKELLEILGLNNPFATN